MHRVWPWLLVVWMCANATPAFAYAITEQQVVDLVRETAVVRMQVPRQDVEVEWQDLALANLLPALPEGAVTLDIPKGASLGGSSHLAVQVSVNGRRYRTIFPKLRVRVYQNVLVAAHRLSAGQVLAEADVRVSRTLFAGGGPTGLQQARQVLGLEVLRDLPANTPLTERMFRMARLVRAGDTLTVVVNSGDLTVIGQGVASTDGAMGQLIKVVNPESKVEFMARVTAPGKVSVDLEGAQ